MKSIFLSFFCTLLLLSSFAHAAEPAVKAENIVDEETCYGIASEDRLLESRMYLANQVLDLDMTDLQLQLRALEVQKKRSDLTDEERQAIALKANELGLEMSARFVKYLQDSLDFIDKNMSKEQYFMASELAGFKSLVPCNKLQRTMDLKGALETLLREHSSK